jgi:hypothetical protein
MILAALALFVAEPQASASAPASVQAPSATIVLPAGLAVRLVTVGVVDSRSVKQGQRFALAMAEDVTVGSSVVIPRGTPAVGEVDAVSGKGAFGMAAKLVVRPLFVDIAGQRVNLVGTNDKGGKGAVTEAAVTTAITPFGLFITGKSAVIPAGSLLLGRVRTDVSLPTAPTGSATTTPAGVNQPKR